MKWALLAIPAAVIAFMCGRYLEREHTLSSLHDGPTDVPAAA